MAPPVGILGPVPAIRGLGFAWKQTGLGSGDLTQYQPRSPVYAVRINVDWRLSWTSQNLLQTTLAALPPFNQLYWPLTPAAQQPERTITASYNPNLIGQDQLPTGKQTFDRPQLGPAQTLREWTLNLLTTTLAPPPVVTNYQPRAPIYSNPREYPYHVQLRTWASTILPYATVISQNPFNQTSWPLTPAVLQPDRSITVAYNKNLIGQDQLPPGEITVSLAPRGYEYRIQSHSWVWNYNLNLIGKDRLPTGEVVYDLTPIAQPQILPRSWTWSYNLNLIGQDQFPSGKIFYERPPLAPSLLQTWLSSINIGLTGTPQNPFYQTSWPLTTAAQQPERSITASYNKNLIGQDQLPFRQSDWPLTPPPYRQPQLSSWIDQVKLLLAVPFRQLDWPVPAGPRQPIIITTGSYNLNLIGQDQLPVGAKISDIPPQPQISAIQLRTWINSVNLALTVVPPQLPFNQYDWPVNSGPRQPTQLFYAFYNKNLIGQDKLPTGKIVSDLPPRGPAPLVQVWLQGFSPFRPPTIILYPHNQFDWPNPRGSWDGMDRTLVERSQFLQPVTPPPQFPNVEAPPVRDFWDVDEWGNFIKGYCVRGR